MTGVISGVKGERGGLGENLMLIYFRIKGFQKIKELFHELRRKGEVQDII